MTRPAWRFGQILKATAPRFMGWTCALSNFPSVSGLGGLALGRGHRSTVSCKTLLGVQPATVIFCPDGVDHSDFGDLVLQRNSKHATSNWFIGRYAVQARI